jgi:hypothetical protein
MYTSSDCFRRRSPNIVDVVFSYRLVSSIWILFILFTIHSMIIYPVRNVSVLHFWLPHQHVSFHLVVLSFSGGWTIDIVGYNAKTIRMMQACILSCLRVFFTMVNGCATISDFTLLLVSCIFHMYSTSERPCYFVDRCKIFLVKTKENINNLWRSTIIDTYAIYSSEKRSRCIICVDFCSKMTNLVW